MNDQFVMDQIGMLQSPATGSQLSISLMSPNTPLPHIDDSEAPPVPPPRSYELRDGRLHKFPQRRTMVVDHVGESECTFELSNVLEHVNVQITPVD